MTRHRARPSFTVEIKRSRTSPLIAPADSERPQSERPANKPPASAPASEPERRPSAGRNLWAGTGLLEEAAAATQSGRFDPPELPVFAPKSPTPKHSARAAPATAPAKRVLPSLIAPPEPEPEPIAAPEPEPKLPRVRRYRTSEGAERPRRAAGPRPAFVWPEDWPDEAPIQTPAPITLPAAPKIQAPKLQAPLPEAAQPAPEAGEIRPRPKRRAGDEDLRIGQRWKRRLPRVCW
jgi:hypothetical protein